MADTYPPLVQAPRVRYQQLATDPAPPTLPPFEQLYRAHFAFTWRALRALGIPAPALDDAAQELWVVAHRRLHEFERRSELRTWLFAIALNVSRNFRRSRRRQPKLAALPARLASVAPDPLLEREGREAWELVNEFLLTLDEPRREVFVCSLLEGFTAPETAQITGLEVATVYDRIRALRRSFKAWAARQRGDV